VLNNLKPPDEYRNGLTKWAKNHLSKKNVANSFNSIFYSQRKCEENALDSNSTFFVWNIARVRKKFIRDKKSSMDCKFLTTRVVDAIALIPQIK